MDEKLKVLNRKIPFYYKINDKLYAIGAHKVFDNNNSKLQLPNVKDLFEIYKKNSSLLEQKKSEDDELKLAKIMKDMVLASFHDISTNKDNIEKIEDLQIFWEDLNEKDRDSLFTQVEKFKDAFKNVKLNIRYPGLSDYLKPEPIAEVINPSTSILNKI